VLLSWHQLPYVNVVQSIRIIFNHTNLIKVTPNKIKIFSSNFFIMCEHGYIYIYIYKIHHKAATAQQLKPISVSTPESLKAMKMSHFLPTPSLHIFFVFFFLGVSEQKKLIHSVS
jgi:hypothetical protein